MISMTGSEKAPNVFSVLSYFLINYTVLANAMLINALPSVLSESGVLIG